MCGGGVRRGHAIKIGWPGMVSLGRWSLIRTGGVEGEAMGVWRAGVPGREGSVSWCGWGPFTSRVKRVIGDQVSAAMGVRSLRSL